MVDPCPLIGHSAPQERLIGLVQVGRLPHALLITGPQGVGKKVFARHLGALVLERSSFNKLELDQKKDFSISSETLRSVYSGIHPNVWFHGDAEETPSSVRRVHVVRSLIEFLQKTIGQDGQARVGILTDLHLFNAQALNALLKTLEEPPRGSYMLLTTHKPLVLPKTILSRLQRVTLGYPSSKEFDIIVRSKLQDLDQESLDFLKSLSLSPGLALLAYELGALDLYKKLTVFFTQKYKSPFQGVPLPFDTINDWVSGLKNKTFSLEQVFSFFMCVLELLFLKKTTYSHSLSSSDTKMVYGLMQEGQQVMRDALAYDLDPKQSLVNLFSLFI